jgi:6-phosphofructokinase
VKLGILCGGGPAPGMNSVISAATIEARNSGWDVLGIMDGFEHLIEGRIEEARPLSITDVSRIHIQGGSMIRTSRQPDGARRGRRLPYGTPTFGFETAGAWGSSSSTT